ncbi:MAG: hypothetical protein ACM3YO_08235, partial [Bacteroidota bacterium]
YGMQPFAVSGGSKIGSGGILPNQAIPTAISVSSDGNTLFVAAGKDVYYMDVTEPSSPREALPMRVSDSQEYQGQAVVDIVAAPGVPNQR